MSKCKLFTFIFLFYSCHIYAENNLSLITVPPVHVTKKKSHVTMTAGPRTIISDKQIALTGATSLNQALRHYSGIQLQDIVGNGSNVAINMRGFGANASSNSLLLIDGIPITNPDLAGPNLNMVPLYAISAIEITAGSESVLYGDQAVGGVVNLITNDHTKDTFSVTCGVGSYNNRQCNAVIDNHWKNWQYNVAANANRTDNYRQHNHYELENVAALINYIDDHRKLKFNLQLANENQQYPGALTAAQVFANRRQSSNATDYFRDFNEVAHLSYGERLNENWRANTDFAFRGMGGRGVLFSSFKQDRDSYYIKPYIHGTWKRAIITAGADAQADDYRLNSVFGLTKDNQQKYGLFALANIPLRDAWSMNIGARGAEQISQLDSTTSMHNVNRAFASTVGVNYHITPRADFYLRRAESFRFPKADENAATTNNVGLRTQRGAAYETGVAWDDGKFDGKLNLYQLNLRDEIAFDPLQTPQDPFGTNRNLSPTVRRGFSLAANSALTSKISVGGQYDYVRARYQNGIYANNRIPLVSENMFNAHLVYYFTEHFNIYTEALYTGNQYSANDDANSAGLIGGYTTYNFNLRYQYKKFTAVFRVNNIFNKEYYYYTVVQPGMPGQFFYPAPERNYLLTLNYAFA